MQIPIAVLISVFLATMGPLFGAGPFDSYKVTRSEFGTYGDGIIHSVNFGAPNQVTLQAAIDFIGPLERELFLYPGIWNIGSQFTVPQNITLILLRGAVLVRTGGDHLYIKGGFKAGKYKCIEDNTPTHNWLVFAPGQIEESCPEWWGAAGDNLKDDYPAIQAAINAGGSAQIIRLQNKAYKISDELNNGANSFTLLGVPGRDNTDNSFDRGGGTIIRQATPGKHVLKCMPPDAGNNRISLYIRDVLFQGCRPYGDTSTGIGSCLYIDGRQVVGTAIKMYLDNVHFSNANEHGLFITGAVYGGSIRNSMAFRCGKNGVRVIGGSSDPIGEMLWEQIRCFGNGQDATATPEERAGLYYAPGGSTNHFHLLSCSNNMGYGAIFKRCSITGLAWQFESNGGTKQLLLGAADQGISQADIGGISFAPGAAYKGTVLEIGFARGVNIRGLAFNDNPLGTGGKHISLQAGARHCQLSEIVLDSGSFISENLAADGGGNLIGKQGPQGSHP